MLSVSEYATAYCKNSSLLKNAEPHIGQQRVLKLDVSGFFDSIDFGKVYGVMCELGFSKPATTLLTNICTYNSILPQGAPTSPQISNLVMKRFDERIGKWCGERGINYTRYCDDFLIGVIGSKEDAEMIKAEVKKFLAEELNLTLSDEKTKITHTSECADFLGYKIKVSRNEGIKRRKDGIKSRPFSGVVKLYVPKENWVKKLLEYEAIKIVTDEDGNEKWKAMHSGKALNKSDIEILSDYNAKVRGLFNYYCIADNAYVIGKFGRAMKYSMMKTFAFKYKTKVSKIKKKYVKNGDFTVSYETKQGLKTSVFYNQGYGKRDSSVAGQVELLPQYKRYDRPNSLARKLKTKTCELCGGYCTELEIHQVKKLKSLKGNSEWERLMLKRRRKTLAVCPKCHEQIHSCDEKR